MRYPSFGLLVVGAMLSLGWQAASPVPPPAAGGDPIPQWVQEGWAYSTQGTGRWVGDNAAYKSADEPWDAYGIQWRWMPGKRGVTGELFGIARDATGVERDSSPMWHFASYWDPERREQILTQFGSHGVFGLGTAQPPSGDHADAIQTFYAPDGSTWRSAHRSWMTGTSNRQQSYDVSASGEWTARRTYTWTLVSR